MLDLYRTVFRSGQLTSIIFILNLADCLHSQTYFNSQALNDPSTFILNHNEGYYNYTVWGLGRCSFGFRIQGVGEGGGVGLKGVHVQCTRMYDAWRVIAVYGTSF